MKTSKINVSENYNPNTTDDQEELLCEVTEGDEVIGAVTRRVCHNETRKPWHRSTNVYLFDSNGNLYLSQRSLTKDTAPGEWTVSTGGHVRFGEAYLETAKRELREELKLDLPLKMIDKLAVDYGSEREIIAIFSGVADKKPVINKEEKQIKVFNFEEIVKKFQNSEFDLSGGSRDSFKHVIETGSLRGFREKFLASQNNSNEKFSTR